MDYQFRVGEWGESRLALAFKPAVTFLPCADSQVRYILAMEDPSILS
jgi:hypothetical protein